MKVKCLCDFHDLDQKVDRKKGQHFECDTERGAHLIRVGYVEEVKAEKPAERRVAAPKTVAGEDEDKD